MCLKKMKETKYTIIYCVFVRTCVMPFFYGSATVIGYGSGSNFLTSYGSCFIRQKVTVLTVLCLVPVPVPVPQN